MPPHRAELEVLPLAGTARSGQVLHGEAKTMVAKPVFGGTGMRILAAGSRGLPSLVLPPPNSTILGVAGVIFMHGL